MPTKKTHFEFDANGETFHFPNLPELPGGFFYYFSKLGKAQEQKNNVKVKEYSDKIYEFVFGIETEQMDAFMSYTVAEQQKLVEKWMAFEQDKYGTDVKKS